MVDLRTTYLGLALPHPVVASASPLSRDLDGIRRLEDGGAAAIVMFSLFEEQVRREAAAIDRLRAVGSNSFAESTSFFPAVEEVEVGPTRYLELIRRARESVAVPIIASLNGAAAEGWVEYARLLEQAGAHAIELNVYFVAADLELTGAEVEARYVDIVAAVKSAVRIPVAIKLAPFFSAFGNLAKRLDVAGADGLVLFNRFYRPDFDLERREAVPALSLSTPDEIRLPLMWIGILFGKLGANIAATTGVSGPEEVTKLLLAGADVVMTTASLLRHGPTHLGVLVAGLSEWLDARGYGSVSEARGSMSHQRVSDPGAFERANYVHVLETYGR